ncbi:MAG: 16S rRNA (cytidine(1402)-2'-O)-methyltransferase [Pseudomonadota bacterium]
MSAIILALKTGLNRLDHSTEQTSQSSATLWVVATPIGNLGDLSPRAQAILAEVPVIAAEDTRVSQKLVPARSTAPHWFSLHEHNEATGINRLIQRLRDGDDVALVSDAGTPLISDPGYRLVCAAHDHGIRVSPVPGPSAAMAALSAAGLATDRFHFEGFLPAKSAARRTRLRALAQRSETLIFYAPARDLTAVLGDLTAEFGPQREAAIARELTKQFETIRRDTLADLKAFVESDGNQQRGETVVLSAGADRTSQAQTIEPMALAHELAQELPPARAARIIARLSGMDRREAFAQIERLRAS